jgi:FkbM family methyltransferase
VYRFFTNRHYRACCILETKLGKAPRFTDCRARVNNWNLSIPDSASFLSAFREIFVERIYNFNSESPAPKILDLGANIGLSVLYFKQLYPKAHITAFEADPKIFDYLKNNVHGNGYTDVVLINKAVWHENTTLKFRSEGADGGRAAFGDDENIIEVDAIDIKTFLEGHTFDFLKMDIEGSEEVVLPACKGYLNNFKYVFVEYHSKIGHKQRLDRILNILTETGFRIHMHCVLSSPMPFIEVNIASGYDLQLNIFGWKE